MRWPSDSATEHLRRCIPSSCLQSAGYSDQFGVNPEVVSYIPASIHNEAMLSGAWTSIAQ